MNVLYILGNGFDMAQGMATSYPEFYKYLIEEVKNASPLLEKMKSAIIENVELWSDMESKLGEFTAVTNNVEEFDDFYFELNGLLQKYLRIENDKFTPVDRLKLKFNNDFVSFGKYLGELDKERYNAFIKRHNFSSKDISVITLNYTDTLEKILELNAGTSKKVFERYTILHNLIHIHGQLGGSIIIGVDDENQIKNQIFRENDDVRDCMIKMQSNQAMNENRHLQCENLIANANLIILMGVSLGETDAHWWKLIGKNLVNRKNIAIIQHLYSPKIILSTQLQKRGRLERRHQNLMTKQMKIAEDNWATELRDRLFFTINAPIFKI